MRILRGLKKEEKCIFYGQKIYIKNSEKKVKVVCLDKLSRQNQRK